MISFDANQQDLRANGKLALAEILGNCIIAIALSGMLQHGEGNFLVSAVLGLLVASAYCGLHTLLKTGVVSHRGWIVSMLSVLLAVCIFDSDLYPDFLLTRLQLPCVIFLIPLLWGIIVASPYCRWFGGARLNAMGSHYTVFVLRLLIPAVVILATSVLVYGVLYELWVDNWFLVPAAAGALIGSLLFLVRSWSLTARYVPPVDQV